MRAFWNAARGSIGGVLAGLDFMLPGFILMFALSWLYLNFNLESTVFQAIFRGIQPYECIGIDRLLNGWARKGMSDDELLAKEVECFNGLYEALRK